MADELRHPVWRDQSAVAHNQGELLLLTDSVDEDTLAWQLFSELDGAVHFFDGGLSVLMGTEHEELTYPVALTRIFRGPGVLPGRDVVALAEH